MFYNHKHRIAEMEKEKRRSNTMNFLEGLVIGSALGVLAGILLAPRSGKETLDEWSDEAKRLYEMGKCKLDLGCDVEIEEEIEGLPEPPEIDLDMEDKPEE